MLDGHEPVAVDDLQAWAEWYSGDNRNVARDVILTTCERGEITVSTVFLGIDTGSIFSETPRLFETMVFGGAKNHKQVRYATWDEAEQGHARIVREVMQATALGLPVGSA